MINFSMAKKTLEYLLSKVAYFVALYGYVKIIEFSIWMKSSRYENHWILLPIEHPGSLTYIVLTAKSLTLGPWCSYGHGRTRTSQQFAGADKDKIMRSYKNNSVTGLTSISVYTQLRFIQQNIHRKKHINCPF